MLEGRAVRLGELALELVLIIAIRGESVEQACRDTELTAKIEELVLFLLFVPDEVAELHGALLDEGQD